MLTRVLALAFALAGPTCAFEVAYKLPGGSEFQGLAVSGPNFLVADTVDGDRFESDLGVVSVYDGATGYLLRTLQDPGGWGGLFGRTLAASGSWVAVTSWYDRVYIFDNRGQLKHTLRPQTPDRSDFGDRLALGGDFLLVRELVYPAASPVEHVHVLIHVFDVKTGALLHTLTGGPGVQDCGDVLAVANGDTLIVATPSLGVVSAYDARIGFERWYTYSPRRHRGDRFGHALSVYGNDLLVGAPGGHRLEFGNAYLLDVRTGEIRRRYHGAGRGSGFGWAVALQLNRVLVGVPDWYARTGMRGKTYLLDKRTGRVLHKFRPLPADSDGYTGGAVAFVGFRPAIVDIRDDSDMMPIIRVFR